VSAGASKDDVDGELGHVNARDLHAGGGVDEDLSVCDMDIPIVTDCNTLVAALNKGAQVAF
jgi:hypothetical protein